MEDSKTPWWVSVDTSPPHHYVDLASDYFEESQLGLTFDSGAVVQYVQMCEISPNHKLVTLVRDERAIGFAVGTVVPLFSREKIGQIEFLYVDPGFRNGFAALALVKELHIWFRSWKCPRIYANSIMVGDSRATEGYRAILLRMGYSTKGNNYEFIP